MNTPLQPSEIPCLKECPFVPDMFAQQCGHMGCNYEEFDYTVQDALGEQHTAVVGRVGHCALRQS